MNLFDILRDVLKDKTGVLHEDPSFDEAFNVFMIARYLSMRRELMPYASWINVNGRNMSKENIYRFLTKSLPKTNNCYIKYIRKVKKDKASA